VRPDLARVWRCCKAEQFLARQHCLPVTKLIYVDDSLPGITRKGAGTGFAYYSPEGDLIRAQAERERLNAIALPPAYTDAWFCPAPNGHILATGVDDRGRKQYRYHPDFRLLREGDKFDACTRFGAKLPLIRARVDQDMRQPQVTETRALASVVRLLDLSAMRVGNEQYSQANASHGATTLRDSHVEVSAGTLHFHFAGKGGKEQDISIDDPRLARAVQRMRELPGRKRDAHLFRYAADDGEIRPISSAMVNAYLREAMGSDFTAKHFRTWHASVLAFDTLAQAPEDVPIRALLDAVSDHLGNTPAIARASYIHPAVIERVRGQGEWRAALRMPRATRWLSREERALLVFLRESGPARDLLAA
jgi:DNA topoisomerase-1